MIQELGDPLPSWYGPMKHLPISPKPNEGSERQTDQREVDVQKAYACLNLSPPDRRNSGYVLE